MEDVVSRLDAHLKSNNLYDELRKVLSVDDRPTRMVRGKRYLLLKVTAGRGFVDTMKGSDVSTGTQLSLGVFFKRTALSSKKIPFTNDPEFGDSFLLPLQDLYDDSVLAPFSKLRAIQDPLWLLLIRHSPQGVRSVLSVISVEWRKVLVHGQLSISLELTGGEEFNDLIGLLDLSMEITPLKMPLGNELPVFIEKKTLLTQLKQENITDKDLERKFHIYAKAWWKDFVAIRESHTHRPIHLFGLGDDGNRRFACTFVQPLRADRCLPSPLHAARFVRLLDYKPEVVVGGDQSHVWHSTITSLIKGHCDAPEHAILLCSLLLGFGMNAYVAVGTKKVVQVAETRAQVVSSFWVVTQDPGQLGVTFWDSITGERFTATSKQDLVADDYPFQNIYALFNHRQFLANIQVDSSVLLCRWSLEEPSLWKCVDERAVGLLPRRYPHLQLRRCTFDAFEEENRLERKLKGLFSEYRKQETKSDMVWDDNFAYVLSPALNAYEHQRITNESMGNSEFQLAIKNYVPLNHIFKGVPFQFSSFRSPMRLLTTMLRHRDVTDMLHLQGDNIRFACRVKICPYAEDISSVWVMLSAHYPDMD